MSDPQMHERAASDDADERRRITIDRIRVAAAEPFTLSAQLAWAVLASFFAVLVGINAVLDDRWSVVGLVLVGAAIAWGGWGVARRTGTLRPYLPAPRAVVLDALLREDGRSLRRVLAGRARATTTAERDLALLVSEDRQVMTRATWPGSIGFAVAANANLFARDDAEHWRFVIPGACVVLFVALLVWERVRARRVDRVLAEVPDDALADRTGGTRR